jgi:hypothetical protein
MLKTLIGAMRATTEVAVSLLFVAALFALLTRSPVQSGDVAAGATGKDPEPSGAPAVSLAPQACSAGLQAFVALDRLEPSLESETAYADSVIVARVEAIEPGIWNTPDGSHAPLSGTWPRGLSIYTPIRLEALEIVKGTMVPTRALVLGGRVGCDEMIVDGREVPATGTEVVLFMKQLVPGASTTAVDGLGVQSVWALGSDGRLTGPEGLVTTIEVLRKTVASST